MNFASVSTISYGDSNDGIFVIVGLLECIKPEIVCPESPRLINFPAKMKFSECARNFSRQLRKHLFWNKLLRKKTSAMVAVPNLARTPQFCNRGQVTINSTIGHILAYDCCTI